MDPLEENLESISLDVDKTRRIVKRSSSSLFNQKGLGLNSPRRPSDGLRKISIQRPISNDSIPSTTGSEFSEVADSRHSSMTSASIDSPVVETKETFTEPYKPSLRLNTSTPVLQSTTSVNTLTPSQKYRLRRVNSSNSRVASKLYDELNSDDETIEDGIIWNVPFTRSSSSIFNPSNGKSPALIKKILEHSPVALPMSPLPGTSSFYIHNDEAKSISKFYEATNQVYVNSEMTKRQISQTTLPQMCTDASRRGLDDGKLISNEKLEVLSPSRPIWLPPKSSAESLKHDKDYQKMIIQIAKKEKKLKEEQAKFQEDQARYKQRWLEFSQSSHSQLVDVQKLCFKCSIPDHLRYKIWSDVMFERLDEPLDEYTQLKTKLESIKAFPESQLQEIHSLTKTLMTKYQKFQKGQELHDKLVNLIQLQMISTKGFHEGDELLFATMLLKFNQIDSFKLVQLIKSTILTQTNDTKFSKSLEKSTLKRYTPEQDHKALKLLTHDSIIKLITHFPEALCFPMFDLVIMKNNYKLWLSLLVVILRDHHLGFNSLEELFKTQQQVMIDDWFKFSSKIVHYYRKF